VSGHIIRSPRGILVEFNLDHLLKAAVADTTAPVDLTTEVTDGSVMSAILTKGSDTSDYDSRIASLEALAGALAKLTAAQIGPFAQYIATTTTKNSSVTTHAIDAIGGTIRNVVVDLYLILDAAATYTPTVHGTSIEAPTTFVQEAIPSISTIATPAADRRYRYELGDVAEGLQKEFRIAQDDNGNATNVVRSVLTHD